MTHVSPGIVTSAAGYGFLLGACAAAVFARLDLQRAVAVEAESGAVVKLFAYWSMFIAMILAGGVFLLLPS